MSVLSIESLLKKYRIYPKKHLGQHFLGRKPTLEKIVTALGIRHTDDVLEIGAGLGVMTAMIALRARNVFAVEKDKTFFAIYENEFGHFKNIHFLCRDILKLDFKKDLKGSFPPIKVIGNIPYNISSPILFKLLENKPLISCAVLTVQQEVARRILARPNTKDYGILAILVQAQARARKLFEIRPACFIPPPEVVSTVIRLDFEPMPEIKIEDMDLFCNLVRAAFGQRRKTIKNSLTGAKRLKIPPEGISRALLHCKIDPMRRAETLLISEYTELANYLRKELDSCL
jgi:16S rRNA (adenine1518-N6/adenine1519-N6)-dimethyltransferase